MVRVAPETGIAADVIISGAQTPMSLNTWDAADVEIGDNLNAEGGIAITWY
jgi:hypothetical protein